MRFDLIAANPPYIADGDPDLAADVRRYEPNVALIAGRSGLEALEEIVAQAAAAPRARRLARPEHGWKQAADASVVGL